MTALKWSKADPSKTYTLLVDGTLSSRERNTLLVDRTLSSRERNTLLVDGTLSIQERNRAAPRQMKLQQMCTLVCDEYVSFCPSLQVSLISESKNTNKRAKKGSCL